MKEKESNTITVYAASGMDLLSKGITTHRFSDYSFFAPLATSRDRVSHMLCQTLQFSGLVSKPLWIYTLEVDIEDLCNAALFHSGTNCEIIDQQDVSEFVDLDQLKKAVRQVYLDRELRETEARVQRIQADLEKK